MDVGCEWFYSPANLSTGGTYNNHNNHNNHHNDLNANNITHHLITRPLISTAPDTQTIGPVAVTTGSSRAASKPRPSSLNINQIRLLNKQFYLNRETTASNKRSCPRHRRWHKDVDLICCGGEYYDDLEAFELAQVLQEEDEEDQRLGPEEFPGEEQGLLDNSSIANCSEYTDIEEYNNNDQLESSKFYKSHSFNFLAKHQQQSQATSRDQIDNRGEKSKQKHSNNHKYPLQLNFFTKLIVPFENQLGKQEFSGKGNFSSSNSNNKHIDHNEVSMATVRPISPQYQHTLDSAISLAKELASKNMADSGESSPRTPNSPDKKRFNFKLKHFSKSFSEVSANIRDIESSISNDEKQAYDMLIGGRGPFYHGSSLSSSSSSSSSSASSHNRSSSYTMHHNHHHTHNQHYNQDYYHSSSISNISSGRSRPPPFGYGGGAGGSFSMHGAGSGAGAGTSASTTFSVKKSFFM